MRAATEADLDQIKAFLTSHIATSMFPLSNLEKYGTEGHDYSMRFRMVEEDGHITGLLSVTKGGMVFPQLAPDCFDAAARELNGLEAIGIIGDAQQVAQLTAAIPQRIEASLDAAEPLFSLKLDDLSVPDEQGASLIPFSPANFDLMLDWRTAFDVEALNADPINARRMAERALQQHIKNNSHRILLVDGEPVSTTGFNATTGPFVQVGGVYTPPELRGRHYARTAVALHLQEARDNGATDAILFSASEAAERAYMAIGFRQIGEFALMLFREPTVINV